MGTTTRRRRWPRGMRMKLIRREALVDRMAEKKFSNRRMAKYAECAPGTIDNLLSGRTQAVNSGRTAELICEAIDMPLDFFFVPEVSSTARQTVQQVRPRRAA